MELSRHEDALCVGGFGASVGTGSGFWQNMFKGWGISMIDPGVQEYSMTDGRDVASTGIN